MMADHRYGPTIKEVEKIIAFNSDPSVRNLQITQCYHDLSQATAALVGDENANWCTFATWASKTAGLYIRNDELSKWFGDVLSNSPQYTKGMEMLNRKLSAAHPKAGLSHSSILGFFDKVMGDVRKNITVGNLKVFSEIGRLFATMNHTFAGDTAFDEAKLEGFLASMKTGSTKSGGQDLLRSAVLHYYRAMFETNPNAKAELMLTSNAQVGLPEQKHLQPYIAGALNPPIADGLLSLVHEDHANRFPGESWLLHKLHSTIEWFIHPIIDTVTNLWQEFATKLLMELQLPDSTLHLGVDLPSLPGQPLFPPALQHIVEPDLRELLELYGADGNSARDSGARDWVVLSQRMKYIFELFRSRQQDAHLLQQPFTAAQREAIAAGRMPEGDL